MSSPDRPQDNPPKKEPAEGSPADPGKAAPKKKPEGGSTKPHPEEVPKSSEVKPSDSGKTPAKKESHEKSSSDQRVKITILKKEPQPKKTAAPAQTPARAPPRRKSHEVRKPDITLLRKEVPKTTPPAQTTERIPPRREIRKVSAPEITLLRKEPPKTATPGQTPQRTPLRREIRKISSPEITLLRKEPPKTIAPQIFERTPPRREIRKMSWPEVTLLKKDEPPKTATSVQIAQRTPPTREIRKMSWPEVTLLRREVPPFTSPSQSPQHAPFPIRETRKLSWSEVTLLRKEVPKSAYQPLEQATPPRREAREVISPDQRPQITFLRREANTATPSAHKTPEKTPPKREDHKPETTPPPAERREFQIAITSPRRERRESIRAMKARKKREMEEMRSRPSTSGAGPSGAGPSRAGPSGAGPSRAGPSGPGPSRAGPSGAGPSRAGPSSAGPSSAESRESPVFFAGVPDPYENASASNYFIRGETGITYDGQNMHHKCEWDDNYPENPSRTLSIMEKCYDKGLLNRCTHVPNHLRTDLYEAVLTVHTKKHYETLKNTATLPAEAYEYESARYDSVYINRSTFDVACRALSSVLNLTEAVGRRDVHNGMAIVRPPGHHAMAEEYNGYCFFNNVAIATEMLLKKDLASKILIVDIDVHHGQGTQRAFYERDNVLYFSIHRYEHGSFWPNLLESNFNYIGKGDGLGYNINVPLNATGLTDDDYLAILFSILLPVGYEFNPDYVIVSAGYDACVGCPEGKMKVTPGFYAHLITHLSALARGRLAVVLEGGYFLPSLSEGVTMTLKALLGGPCPVLEPTRSVHPSVTESICNVRRTLMRHWKCFSLCEINYPEEQSVPDEDEHQYQMCYVGAPQKPPFPTRDCYPENSIPENNYYSKYIKACREKYRGSVKLPVFVVHDETMNKHAPQPGEAERPERPERVTAILEMFVEFGIDTRLVRVPIIRRDFSAYSVHDPAYIAQIGARMVAQTKDIYTNNFTADSVTLGVSGMMTLIDQMMSGLTRSAVGIIRPPGHHAEYDKAMGFCFANNVAIAANYLYKKYNQTRILIVDFDIHHGNGTQNAFYNSDNVMYISIHRDEDGKFFPPGSARNYTYDGYGVGKGYNINIPFSKDKMGDSEYIMAFHNIILPIAYSYAPQVILVSAGFDAGINDPLGNYNVSPETFGHFIQMLKPLAEGRIILCLEGGYNVTTTAYGMTICTKALLGDPVMMPKNLYQNISESAITTMRKVIDHFKPQYDVLKVNKKLGYLPKLYKKIDRFGPDTYAEGNYKILDPNRFEDSDYVAQEVAAFNATHN